MESIPLNFDGIKILSQYGLDEKDLINCEIHTYESGEYVLHQGSAIRFLYVIIGGTAKVCINAKNGKNLILCHYVSQGIMGDVELMLEEYTASTTIIAVSEFSCVAIPFSSNAGPLKRNLQFVNFIGQNLSLKLLSRSDAHMASALFSSEERLCSYILHAEHNGMFTDYLTDVAQSVGISYRHVFRIINKLCQLNILEKTKAGFCISDMDKLKEKSCSNRTLTEI